MTTVSSVIERAGWKARVRPVGQAMSAQEAAIALDTLQAFYLELIEDGVFGRLTETITDVAYEAAENERIYNSTASPVAITLPETVEDAFTGDDRPPRDLSVVVIAGEPIASYIYSAQIGAWQAMTSLVPTSTAPLAEKSFDGLTSALAVRLCNEFGKDPTGTTVSAAKMFRSRLASKASRPRVDTEATYY